MLSLQVSLMARERTKSLLQQTDMYNYRQSLNLLNRLYYRITIQFYHTK